MDVRRVKRRRSKGISLNILPEAYRKWRVVYLYEQRANESTGAKTFERFVGRAYERIARDARTTPWIQDIIDEVMEGRHE